MQKQLPETLNFLRQVERSYRFEGSVSVADLDRLSGILAETTGEAEVSFEFGSCVGFACLKGHVSVDLQVQCQRCLQPMTVRVDSNFKFALVHSEEEADELPDEFEPYLIEGDDQSIKPLLEDEILLSLPMVSRHELDCSAFFSEHEKQVKADKEAAHPFAVLKGLKGAE